MIASLVGNPSAGSQWVKKRATYQTENPLTGATVPRGSRGCASRGSSYRSPWVRVPSRTLVPNAASKRTSMFDSGMLAGDVIMILVTECASSRIPYDVWIQLACVLAGSWVLVSLLKGDYMRSFDADSADSMLDFTLGFDAEDTAENALATWLLFAPTCMLFWANTPWYLDMSMEVVQNPHLRPPEVELVISLFLIMTCWRFTWAWIAPPRDKS